MSKSIHPNWKLIAILESVLIISYLGYLFLAKQVDINQVGMPPLGGPTTGVIKDPASGGSGGSTGTSSKKVPVKKKLDTNTTPR